MTAKLSIEKFLETEIEKIATNSYDSTLYRLYLGAGRFQPQILSASDRNKHPDWWNEATGHKSFFDSTHINEYGWTKNTDVLAPFLASMVNTFGVKAEHHLTLTQAFVAEVESVHRQMQEYEQAFRGKNEQLH